MRTARLRCRGRRPTLGTTVSSLLTVLPAPEAPISAVSTCREAGSCEGEVSCSARQAGWVAQAEDAAGPSRALPPQLSFSCPALLPATMLPGMQLGAVLTRLRTLQRGNPQQRGAHAAAVPHPRAEGAGDALEQHQPAGVLALGVAVLVARGVLQAGVRSGAWWVGPHVEESGKEVHWLREDGGAEEELTRQGRNRKSTPALSARPWIKQTWSKGRAGRRRGRRTLG